jgi:energy-coupling factor transport system ATP-binding protein
MLAVGQRLLILDEPTFGQDRLTAQSLMEDLVELNRQGVVILMITHDMRLVRRYAHRAAVLLEGRIALEGTPDHLFSQPELLDAAQLR